MRAGAGAGVRVQVRVWVWVRACALARARARVWMQVRVWVWMQTPTPSPHQVSAVLPDGLRLSFAAYFSGTVSLEHVGVSLPGWAEEVDERQQKKKKQLGQKTAGPAFVEGQKVTARLLWLEPTKKRFGFSLLAHQLECVAFAPPANVVPGSTLSASVEAVTPQVSPTLTPHPSPLTPSSASRPRSQLI